MPNTNEPTTRPTKQKTISSFQNNWYRLETSQPTFQKQNLVLTVRESDVPISLKKQEKLDPSFGRLFVSYLLEHSKGDLPVSTAIDKIYIQKNKRSKSLVFERQENGTYKDLRLNKTVDNTQRYLQATEKFLQKKTQDLSNESCSYDFANHKKEGGLFKNKRAGQLFDKK